MKVPRVPLIKLPPTFKVPAPEKIIRELTPAEVILLETFTVPVEIVKSEYLVPVEPDKAKRTQFTVPAPT